VSWKLKYNIEFKGLNEGLHDFEFEVDNKFFEHFEDSLVENGKVKVGVVLEKRSSFIKLHFKLKGWLELTCDRCLDLYEQPIEHETEMFVKFGENEYDDGESVIWIHPGEHQINLAQIIYEFVTLCIPLRHVHPKNNDGKRNCDKEMLEKLKNYTHPESEKESPVDPRWDALRRFENNN
jgi:uncharacterized metal-binding protein YceD (DUF177 family)